MQLPRSRGKIGQGVLRLAAGTRPHVGLGGASQSASASRLRTRFFGSFRYKRASAAEPGSPETELTTIANCGWDARRALAV